MEGVDLEDVEAIEEEHGGERKKKIAKTSMDLLYEQRAHMANY